MPTVKEFFYKPDTCKLLSGTKRVEYVYELGDVVWHIYSIGNRRDLLLQAAFAVEVSIQYSISQQYPLTTEWIRQALEIIDSETFDSRWCPALNEGGTQYLELRKLAETYMEEATVPQRV